MKEFLKTVCIVAALLVALAVFSVAFIVFAAPKCPPGSELVGSGVTFYCVTKSAERFGCTKTYVNDRGEDTGECP